MNLVCSVKDQSDEKLALLAKNGDDMALDLLIRRFAPVVKSRARFFARYGLDSDDLYQEGMIALLKAVRNYREDASGSFKTFMITCINNKLISALKAHMRNKNAPMRDYLSLSELEDTVEKGMTSVHTDIDPQNLFIEREEIATHNQHINTLLSQFEQQVFKLYLSSYSYDEMSEKLGFSTKAVDNALQRVRRKLRASLKD